MPSIKVILSARAQADISRLYRFLLDKDALVAQRAIAAIRDAFLPLQAAPLMGRPVENHAGLRELVIEYGTSGYLALYRHELACHTVVILAIKHQREDDYQ